MGKRVTIGGDRIGSGKKMKASLSTYRRTTFNLSRQVRATMAPGPLYPIVTEPLLTKDTFDINLKTLIKTIPAQAPLFGSYKLQADVFSVPMRLYNKQMHNNPVGLGLHTDKVLFPLIRVTGNDINRGESAANESQINQSSLMAYTGVRGLGRPATPGNGVSRTFNAMPILAYYDIFKSYYANKQEDDAYVIRATTTNTGVQADSFFIQKSSGEGVILGTQVRDNSTVSTGSGLGSLSVGDEIIITGNGLKNIQLSSMGIVIPANISADPITVPSVKFDSAAYFEAIEHTTAKVRVRVRSTIIPSQTNFSVFVNGTEVTEAVVIPEPTMQPFALSNIDDMRESLLSASKATPYIIEQNSGLFPYAANNEVINTIGGNASGCLGNMVGLVVKTYQSDRFNNWVNTEWIDGEGGISELTAVDTSEGSFTMDDLNLRQKIYNMLNNIGMAGGTLKNWREAVYGVTLPPDNESPEYHGGMSSEIFFDDVVSHTDGGEESPLGSLAGRGVLGDGGRGTVRVGVSEESYLMIIVSITPKVDYSQGNKWFTEITNLDQWHKPELDQIGFQSTPTWEAAAFDRVVNDDGTLQPERSFGKQPAWTEYMTSQNEVYGDFAEEMSQMSMVLNRRYGCGADGALSDATTYIDPTKFNYVFAGTDLTYENFWVQFNVDIKARRIMSGAIMPRM